MTFLDDHSKRLGRNYEAPAPRPVALRWDGVFARPEQAFQAKAQMVKQAYIKKIGPNKWGVYSEEGKSLGTYESEAGAKKRLQQVEYFKHKGQRSASKEFNYEPVAKGMWNDEISIGRDVFGISFDTENDSVTKEKDIVVPQKEWDHTDCKFHCALCYAGGDWQNSIIYFRCQLTDGYSGRPDGKEAYSHNQSAYFIVIPSKADGNPHLAKTSPGSKHELIAPDDKDGLPEPDEKKAWEFLTGYLKRLVDRQIENNRRYSMRMDEMSSVCARRGVILAERVEQMHVWAPGELYADQQDWMLELVYGGQPYELHAPTDKALYEAVADLTSGVQPTTPGVTVKPVADRPGRKPLLPALEADSENEHDTAEDVHPPTASQDTRRGLEPGSGSDNPGVMDEYGRDRQNKYYGRYPIRGQTVRLSRDVFIRKNDLYALRNGSEDDGFIRIKRGSQGVVADVLPGFDRRTKAVRVKFSPTVEAVFAVGRGHADPRRFLRKAGPSRWRRFAQMHKIEIVDRYDALGIPKPDVRTMCSGQCEGTGFVPVHADDHEEPFHTLWAQMEQQEHADDGWHFVTCPGCQGTGLRKAQAQSQELPGMFPQDKIQLDALTRRYVETALWSSTDDDGRSLDDTYNIDDLGHGTLVQMEDDVHAFVNDAAPLLEQAEEKGYSVIDAARDFWLTRNRHGVGFWDRGLGEVGEQLTELAHGYGEAYLYVGDDGLVHQMGAERRAQRQDHVSGGLADRAEESDFDSEQLEMGQRVEQEHTDDPQVAREIAMDHLKEYPDYYTRLKRMEDQAGERPQQKIALLQRAQTYQYNQQQQVQMQVPPGQAGQFLGLNVPGTVVSPEEPGKYKVKVPGTGTASGQETEMLAVDETYNKPDAQNYLRIAPPNTQQPSQVVQPVQQVKTV